MEKKSVSANEVRDIIYNKAIEAKISVNNEENDFIENILKDLPNNLNAKSLTIWCNNKINEKIKDYPNLIQNIEKIRSEVRNEIKYLIDIKVFEEAKSKLDHLKKLNPEIISKEAPQFYSRIMYGYKNSDGKPDWYFVAKKLGIYNRFSVSQFEYNRNIYSNMLSLLEKENPKTFNSSWIKEKDPGLFNAIAKELGSGQKGINWDLLIKKLPDEWKSKWTYFEKRYTTSMEELIKNIINKVEQDNPNHISPGWIQDNLYKDYKALVRKLPSNKGNLRWQTVIDLLPEDISKKWKQEVYLADVEPDSFYENKEEVENSLKDYKSDLILFFRGSLTREELLKRENIIILMSELAQKGNKEALDRIIDYIYFTIEQEIVDYPDSDLKIWKYATDKCKDKIRSCVLKYNINKGFFFRYLRSTLVLSIPEIKKEAGWDKED